MITVDQCKGLIAESELKTGKGVKSKKEPESESKAGPGLKLRIGLGSKTRVETKSKLKVWPGCLLFPVLHLLGVVYLVSEPLCANGEALTRPSGGNDSQLTNFNDSLRSARSRDQPNAEGIPRGKCGSAKRRTLQHALCIFTLLLTRLRHLCSRANHNTRGSATGRV
ncbi:hypothetical protein EVAR_6270_1 [Eumeta japonica]|uniref:Uncharacterized protein n=1 Tax=Eumeta variegata TaxID=151549 RepID=A0A4C1T873_EUMVA|nr:hypothetical protein EVAR_6270_1 [Eumeta japonica]